MRYQFKPTKVTLCVAGFLHSIASSASMVLTSMNLAYNINEPWSGQIWATLFCIGIMILTDSIKTSLTINPPQCIVPSQSIIKSEEDV
jgi:hypothetical protein